MQSNTQGHHRRQDTKDDTSMRTALPIPPVPLQHPGLQQGQGAIEEDINTRTTTPLLHILPRHHHAAAPPAVPAPEVVGGTTMHAYSSLKLVILIASLHSLCTSSA